MGSWVLLARPPEHTHEPHGGDCIRFLLPTILGGLPDPRGCPRATKPQRGKQLVGHGSKQQSLERSPSLKPGLGLLRPLTHMPGPLGTGLPGVTVAPGMPCWTFSAAKAGTVSSGVPPRDEETEPGRASVAFPEQREDLHPCPPGLQRDTGLGGHSAVGQAHVLRPEGGEALTGLCPSCPSDLSLSLLFEWDQPVSNHEEGRGGASV